MGLFSKKSDTPTGLTAFLADADKALSKALQTKQIAPLQQYVDQNCARRIMARIRQDEREYAGLERYKHVDWAKIGSSGDTAKYKKSVSYDHVKLSRGVVAPVGIDYVEEWTVVTGDKPRVTDIRRLGA